MVIPTQQQAYSRGPGTSPIPQFKFSDTDPPTSNSGNFPLYQGWVNTVTKGIWYLEGVTYSGGTSLLSWRAVAPIVQKTTSPSSADYQYPLGQTWVNTTGQSYWGLVSVVGTTATWVDLSAGSASGVLTVTGNSGGPVSPDMSRNLNLIGAAGINIVGSPGSNTLTVGLEGGSIAVDSIGVDFAETPGTDPTFPTAGGEIFFTGGQIAAGTQPRCIQIASLAANTVTVQVQRTEAVGSSTVGSNGVGHFNSADFTVDSNGFVSALGSGFARTVEVDAHTAPGTDPVTATSLGVITVTGGQVAAGTTTNAIQTNSLAANTYTIQAQRSQATAISTIGANGISHFNSAHFTVDSNGWVSGGGSGGGISEINVQVFTTSGTYTPTSGMVYAWAQLVGAGGGGGGASIDGGDVSPSGSGAGGGQYASKVFTAAEIGASQVVTIGAGGTGGVGAADGVDGSATSLGSLLSVAGGVKGQYMRTSGPVQEGGDGGQALTGTADYSTFGGGGGYAINTGGAVVSGAGGSSLLSPGGKARGVAADGVPGGGYGGGGSGGKAAMGVPATGGAGDDGVIIVTEYIV